jgi:hypothetical protein
MPQQPPAVVSTPSSTIGPQVAIGSGPLLPSAAPPQDSTGDIRSSPQKRLRDEGEAEAIPQVAELGEPQGGAGEPRKKKKRKKNKEINLTM